MLELDEHKLRINALVSPIKELSSAMACKDVREIILPCYVERLHGIDRKGFLFMERFGKNLYRIFRYETRAKNE